MFSWNFHYMCLVLKLFRGGLELLRILVKRVVCEVHVHVSHVALVRLLVIVRA